MLELIDEILDDLDWRSSQLGKLKIFDAIYKLRPKDSEFILRYSPPIIYSIWEGFISNSFSLYTREINKLEIPNSVICKNLLTYSLDSKMKLATGRVNFDKKVKFVKYLENFFNNSIKIENKLPTKSNVDFDTINEILTIFRFDLIPEDTYKYNLNKLLSVRNKIAHGESSVIINNNDISNFINLVNDLMTEIVLRFEVAINAKVYEFSN